jgi:SPP1 gp7 family putative phage head morphogenesis protein
MAKAARRPPRTIAPVHPNAGIEAAYRKRLEALIDEMHGSLTYWLTAAYNKAPPVLAQDARPAMVLRWAFRRLAKRWEARFAKLAPDLAAYFAKSAADRSDGALKAALKAGGMTVAFRPTAAVDDVLRGSIHENVSLIKSIAQQHLAHVEQLVARSVQQGRDLGWLTKELEDRYDLTRNRAAFIAHTQNNMATSAIQRARFLEIGVEDAVWQHSGAGRHPRVSHVAYSGKTYNVREGALIDGERIFPGMLPNCRCTCCAVIPGLRAD